MEDWKRSVYTIWVAETFALIGFSFALPFLPYYIQTELGISDYRQVVLWAGILTASPSLLLMVSAPFWGTLADRYGRKLMLVRGMYCGCVILVLMGFVRDVHQLLALRLLQGFFTGTMAAANALATSVTPRQRTGYSLGLLQTGVYIGSFVGPWIGGVSADLWGYRTSFVVSGLLIGLGGLLITLLVREDFVPRAPDPEFALGDAREAKRKLHAIYAIFFLISLGGGIPSPVFPLFVQRLVSTTAGLASTAGGLFAVYGIAGGLSAVVMGKASDRWGGRAIVVPCIVAASAAAMAQVLVRDIATLWAVRFFLGFVSGGISPALNALMYENVARKKVGRTFGTAGGASSFGFGVGPIIGGALASVTSVTAPFLLGGVVLLTAGLFAGRLFADRPRARSAQAP